MIYNYKDISKEIMNIQDKFLNSNTYLKYDKTSNCDVVLVNLPKTLLKKTYTIFEYYCNGCGNTMRVNSKCFNSTINTLAKENAVLEYFCDACGWKVIFEFKVGNVSRPGLPSLDNNPLNTHD